MGIRVIVYPDDLLILAESHELAKSHVTLALNLLESLEFSVNFEKSILTPNNRYRISGVHRELINSDPLPSPG